MSGLAFGHRSRNVVLDFPSAALLLPESLPNRIRVQLAPVLELIATSPTDTTSVGQNELLVRQTIAPALRRITCADVTRSRLVHSLLFRSWNAVQQLTSPAARESFQQSNGWDHESWLLPTQLYVQIVRQMHMIELMVEMVLRITSSEVRS